MLYVDLLHGFVFQLKFVSHIRCSFKEVVVIWLRLINKWKNTEDGCFLFEKEAAEKDK